MDHGAHGWKAEDEDDDARTTGGGAGGEEAGGVGAGGDARSQSARYADEVLAHINRRPPSRAVALGLLDLLEPHEWRGLGKAAGIPTDEINQAFTGPATPAVTALVAWIVPALWTIMAARRAIATESGLAVIVRPGDIVLSPQPALIDAVLTSVLLERSDAFGGLLHTTRSV